MTTTVQRISLQNNFAERLVADSEQLRTLDRAEATENLARSLLVELEEEFRLARERHSKIILSTGAESKKYVEDDVFSSMRRSYHKLWATLHDLIPVRPQTSHDESNTTFSHPQCSSATELKLPKIDLPTFSGAYEDWMAFNNMFTATVHNNTFMDPLVKLQRLKRALSGEAELIVRNLELNERNYAVARALLASRYQHTRRLVNSYLKKLYDLAPVKLETANALKTMLNTLNDCCSALQQLKVNVEDYQLVFHMCRKLPQSFLSSWEESQGSSTDLPTYEKFREFLETRFRMMEMIEPTDKTNKSFHISSDSQREPTSKNKKKLQVKKGNPKKALTACLLCKGNHKIGKCENFTKLSQAERFQAIKSSNSCINCLDASHTVQSCWSNQTCRVCQKKHHTLLHRYDGNNNANSTPPPLVNQNFHISTHEETGTLLGTAQLRAVNPHGLSIIIRALIDPCSEDSYILSSTAQTLNLRKYHAPSTIGVMGEDKSTECTHRVNLTVKSTDDNFEFKLSAGVVDKLTSNLPSVYLPTEAFGYFNDLLLADSKFNEPGCVHMLLGVEFHTKIRLDKSYSLGQNLIAENTRVGYLIRGKAPTNSPNSSKVFMTKSSSANLSVQIQKFWEMEEVNSKPLLHPDDALCETIFCSTIQKDSEGYLSMDLPFRSNSCPDIGPSRSMALKRFLSLEKKLKMNPALREEYHKTITNYLMSDHLRKAPLLNEQCLQQYYLPHHAVVKESSSTTKVRVVFDASCRSLDGTSLNDHLLTGQKLQRDIRDVLFNWRQYPFSLTGDIEKMYLMFKISPKHHQYQKIVWRFNETDPIEDFILTRATFGTSCAPFLAMRSLLYIADLHEKSHPIVSKALRNEFYVDDFLSGGFSVNEALEKQTAIRKVLQNYHLILRKWSSNDPHTLANIPDALLETSNELEFEESEIKKTLGIFWSRDKDAFFFSITPSTENCQYTKRQVLSLIARLYDPLGWVSPCTMLAKHLMQKIWQTKTDWDDIVEEPICSQFKTFFNELPLLRDFSVPRWTSILDSNSPLTIFGFSDASDKGYSAVVYLLEPRDRQSLILLTSKTKVADLKFQSTARLELNGAVLLSELLKWTVKMYAPRSVHVYAFCDSQIVLAWLKGHPSKWKTYIANRTTQILEWMEESQWHYVDTKINPADCASRGLLPSELINHNLWLHGPPLDKLMHNQVQKLDETQQNVFEESIKKSSLVLHTKRTLAPTDDLLSKISNHGKLVRVITAVTNFIKGIVTKLVTKLNQHPHERTNHKRERYNIILYNLENPEAVIFRSLQKDYYNEDIKFLHAGKDLSKDSKIKSLHPFIDGHGILRVGGRLQNSELTFEQQHPIILPQRHQVVTNLIREAHEKTMHGTELLTIAYLRHRFHIPRASEKVRHFIHSCMTCFRFAKQQQETLMGNLPKDRVNLARAFQHCGVDYAGPLTTKAYKGRCKKFSKSYIALFVCLCTKALHLEVVSDLSSPSFLAAFKRFVGRRGRVHRMYSDNGTNFVGANRILQSDVIAAEKSWKTDLDIELKDLGTDWHFIPPATPHFGGLWEAGVKSVKTHLNKTIGSSLLTFEELSTVLIQIEAVLNSRPLCPISNHPEEFNFLSPAHFLIGESLVAPPEQQYDLDRRTHLQRWNHVQLTAQRFAKLWKRDYLNKLQNRPKGLRTSTEYCKGDLVLLADDDVPPTVWPTMVVDETHPGTDNVVRVVTLRSSSGKTVKRPVTKLRRLPCNSLPEF